MSLTYPEDRSYHSEHLWAKSEPDGTMLVGITDYAQDQLGGVIFVDLPAVGEHFKQGVSCASIESVKITSDAIIPVSGEIVAVNETLADAPELLNDSPYDKGWLVRVKPDDADEGGRISAAAAAVGTMLQIKPLLHVDDEGKLRVAEKPRGRKQAIRTQVAHMKEGWTPEMGKLVVIG
ncbi:MAG: glycine cleavage system protein GcvH, partial [Bilophila wadsworthia]